MTLLVEPVGPLEAPHVGDERSGYLFPLRKLIGEAASQLRCAAAQLAHRLRCAIALEAEWLWCAGTGGAERLRRARAFGAERLRCAGAVAAERLRSAWSRRYVRLAVLSLPLLPLLPAAWFGARPWDKMLMSSGTYVYAEIYAKDLMVTYESPEKAFVAP